MIYGLKFAATYLLGLDQAGRNFQVYPDDTFIVNYPRSGSQWTRFLTVNLVWPDQSVTFTNVDRLVPAAHSVSSRALKRVPQPRIIKCHNYFDQRYRNVIYIVRDPRDVVLSEYRWGMKQRRIADDYPMELFVARFLKGEVHDYSSWKEHVGSWLATRSDSDRFLLLRYEDMLENTVRELAKIATFLKIDASPERLSRAVERSSADRMRALEKKEGDSWVTTKGTRKDFLCIDKCKAGVWRSSLPKAYVTQIENAWGPLMTTLGYELTCGATRT